jgi:hypothetical protein
MNGVKHLVYGLTGGSTQAYGVDDAHKCFYTSTAGDLSTPYLAYPPSDASFSDVADQAARLRLLGKYLDARKTWRGGNFLAEFAETVHQLRHPVQSLFGATFEFAKQVEKLKRFANNAALYAHLLGNLWISYSFGWKPLFEDIKDANKALQKLNDGTGADTKKLSAAGYEDIYLGSVTVSAPNAGVASYSAYDQVKSSTRSKRYYGALVARPESFCGVLDTFGISAGDFLPAVWEAIPWSFFIDYFTTIGPMIDSMQYARTDFGWMMAHTRNVSRYVYSGWYPVSLPPMGIVSEATVAGYRTTTTTFDRGFVPDIPYPSFRFRVPGIDSKKWFNVAGLVAQIAGSRPFR